MSIPVSQLKVGDSYVSESGKGGVRTITFLGEIKGGAGANQVNIFDIPAGIAYIERYPRKVVASTVAGKPVAFIDQTDCEATTLHITSRESFAKWASYRVLVSFSE